MELLLSILFDKLNLFNENEIISFTFYAYRSLKPCSLCSGWATNRIVPRLPQTRENLKAKVLQELKSEEKSDEFSEQQL